VPNLGSVKGKTTRRPTEDVKTTWTKVPRELLEKYGSVTLAIYIMARNKMPFMISTSRNIHFGTAEFIHNKTKQTLMKSIPQIARAYQARGFQIHNILGNGGFEYIRNVLSEMGLTLNVKSRNKHWPEVKRFMRKITERVRAIASSQHLEDIHQGL